MLLQWKDVSTTWVLLKDAKVAYPVQIAEYTIAAGIAEQRAFNWWVPFTRIKREVNKSLQRLRTNIGYGIISWGSISR